MILDKKIEMGEEYKKEQRELLEPILKYYFNGFRAYMSYDVPQTYRIAAQIVAALGIILIIFDSILLMDINFIIDIQGFFKIILIFYSKLSNKIKSINSLDFNIFIFLI